MACSFIPMPRSERLGFILVFTPGGKADSICPPYGVPGLGIEWRKSNRAENGFLQLLNRTRAGIRKSLADGFRGVIVEKGVGSLGKQIEPVTAVIGIEEGEQIRPAPKPAFLF